MAMDPTSCLIIDGDELLNFSLDDDTNETKPPSSLSFDFSNPNSGDPDDFTRSFPEFVEEEELEWLSNKDAFPSVDTCFDILSSQTLVVVDHPSPISVLVNSTSSSGSHSNSTITSSCSSLLVPVRYPVRKRSKRRHRSRRVFPVLPGQQCWRLPPPSSLPEPPACGGRLGRRCHHCLAEKTPQWRAGPMGPKTLCNACGVRYKSGRLVPEYRPASSPTFSDELHSNSHRKIVEMRRVKQGG